MTSRLYKTVEMLSLGTVPKTDAIGVRGGLRASKGQVCEYWELRAVLGSRVTIPLRADPAILERIKRELRENVTQYVFGEFREPLHILRANLYENGDLDNAARVSAILDTMFGN